MRKHRYAVIIAGGRGTRFWPLSRSRRPKPVLKFLSPKSLIRATVDRIVPLVGLENIVVVTVAEQFKEIRRSVEILPRRNFILEPYGRNTGPCIGLAAVELLRRDPEAVMTVLPADHWISDPTSFRKTLTRAWKVVEANDGSMLTVGVRPQYPETGYGYIVKGPSLASPAGKSTYRVKAFTEKPRLKEAQRLVRSGSLWNSGIFVWKAATILAALKTHAPAIHRGLLRIQSATRGKSLAGVGSGIRSVLQKEYRRLPDLSIDHGVLEKAGSRGKVLAIQANFGWSDVGSWASLYRVLPHDRRGNAARGKWLGMDSTDCLVHASGRLVVLLGLRQVMVVDTPDALLVGDIRHSQKVRELVAELERRGHGRAVQ